MDSRTSGTRQASGTRGPSSTSATHGTSRASGTRGASEGQRTAGTGIRGLLAVVLALLLVLSGCAASTGDMDAGAPQADSAADVVQPGEGEEAAGAAATDDSGAEAADGAEVADAGLAEGAQSTDAPMMVRRAELEVVVEDVTAAVARARATATGAGGWVESEEVSPGTEDRPGYGSLVLRVPAQGLDGVLTSLGELGTVTASRSSAENVSAEYRDVEARIATLEAGADRLRELVGQAGSIDDIASLERELANREAELDALKARMKVLSEDVARSTVTLHLAEDGSDLAQGTSTTGFVAGVQQGWTAFTSSVTVLLTALGALLPFLALAALVLVPFLWWRRRRRTPRTPVAASPAVHERLESQRDRRPDAAGDQDRP